MTDLLCDYTPKDVGLDSFGFFLIRHVSCIKRNYSFMTRNSLHGEKAGTQGSVWRQRRATPEAVPVRPGGRISWPPPRGRPRSPHGFAVRRRGKLISQPQFRRCEGVALQ